MTENEVRYMKGFSICTKHLRVRGNGIFPAVAWNAEINIDYVNFISSAAFVKQR